MNRKLVERQFSDKKLYIEVAGLSTDTKPASGIVTGSRFIEVDTGKEYRFDEVSGEWYEQKGVEM